MLEIGREMVYGEASDAFWRKRPRSWSKEAMGVICRRAVQQPFEEIEVAGASLVADLAGALYWPQERLLVVADLHLEKGSSFARRGSLLPPYDTADTLARLRRG